ncbi:MAG: flavodoxin-dependent (E)-4-hydroxy-3-methylbut-2-enyl-diphosphate synthase [Candidatus Omnitrophica bacterium]|nr:flavodoxin-dependent (E)-4-hydroxy-3-methylbut-2-enyl-diphosphate synthase [Candidatus Omnitrophota bacterium]
MKIGNIKVGGNNPIAIQSMTNTHTKDVKKTIAQIKALQKCGCEIVRVAVKDHEDATAISKIKKSVSIPIVADIHFNYLLAIEAMENGADKIRINPGNINNKEHLKKIILKAKEYKIPIRIGLNSGSIDGAGVGAIQKAEARGQRPEVVREKLFINTVLEHIKFFEKNKFFDIVISLKSSSVQETISLHQKLSDKIKYPMHIGITEAGTKEKAIVKSSVGIGALLLQGIGDTIRVSITGDPVQEIKAAQDILQACEIRQFRPNIVSCPTCGRCQVNLEKVVKQFEKALETMARSSQLAVRCTVALMGCEVNGPGEAKHADIGIAFGKGSGVIFKKGKLLCKVSEKDAMKRLIAEIKGMI